MKPWVTLLVAAIGSSMLCGTSFAAPQAVHAPDSATHPVAPAANHLALPPAAKSGQPQQEAIEHFIAIKTGQLKTAGQAVSKTANTVVDRTSDIVLSAMGFIGVPYHRGGTSFETGFDCSGFVHALFEQTVGLALPRVAKQQAQATQVIAKSDLKPGDLVFFNTMRRAFSHVGIYIGDNKFIHSPRSGSEIRIEDMSASYWQRRFNGARRVDLPKEVATTAQQTGGTAKSTPADTVSMVSTKDLETPLMLSTSPSLTLSAQTAVVAADPLKNTAKPSDSTATHTPAAATKKTSPLQLKPSKDLSNSSL